MLNEFLVLCFAIGMSIVIEMYQIRRELSKSMANLHDDMDLKLQHVVNKIINLQTGYEDLQDDITSELHTININVQRAIYRPKDCRDLYEHGRKDNGIYKIWLFEAPHRVYCDMKTDGGGWTVFQRRFDGSQNFVLAWSDYQAGFGNVNGEYWFGNDKLHELTSQESELRIDMGDFSGVSKYAHYNTFNLGNIVQGYRLKISGYAGTAGDSLSYHNGQEFHTFDRDYNDCASRFKGAWWYDECHKSNLNGLHIKGNHSSFADGVNWFTWRGYFYSLRFTEMKVRRKKNSWKY